MKGYDPYEAIAIAIVEHTADDYTRALCASKGVTRHCIIRLAGAASKVSTETLILECERFFMNKARIGTYSGIDGKALMERLQKEAKEYDYDYKAIIKSRGPKKTENVESEELYI